MYYNLLNATCNLDLPESDRIINKLIVVADKEETFDRQLHYLIILSPIQSNSKLCSGNG